jgi:hypothetical protein
MIEIVDLPALRESHFCKQSLHRDIRLIGGAENF